MSYGPTEIKEALAVQDYCGLPVVVVDDLGDGWVIALWPDKANPGKHRGEARPYTYRRLEWWRLWAEQLRDTDLPVELPEFPVVLQPKPEGESG